MERLLNSFLSAPDGWEEGEGSFDLRLPIDVSETDDSYIVRASIPGINPEDLDISVENSTLSIRGETTKESEREGERWHIKERRFGSFQRSISLPNNVDADQVGAQYADGVLTLTVPKSEQAKPRKISVSSSGQHNGQQTIEGQAQPRNGQQMSEGQAQQRKGR
jgi:HSP20 family protein